MKPLLLRLMGCLLLVTAATATGFALSGRLKRRLVFLERVGSFLNSLKTRLRYQGGDICTLVNACADESGLTIHVETTDEPFTQKWTQAVETLSLCKEDVDFLVELGSRLGATDLDGQLSHLSLMQVRLDTLIQESRERIANQSRIYKTMGFFAGVSAAILLM